MPTQISGVRKSLALFSASITKKPVLEGRKREENRGAFAMIFSVFVAASFYDLPIF